MYIQNPIKRKMRKLKRRESQIRIQSLLEKIQQIKIIIRKGKAGLIEHNEIKLKCLFTPQVNLKCFIIIFF